MAMSRRNRFLLFAPFAVIGLVLFIALGGQLVMLLWNWLLPPLFGVREITFWQALGLLVLSRILFGGLGMRGHSGRPSRAAFEAACERAFRRMDDNWDRMTPEERERFRQRMRDRFGVDRGAAGGGQAI